MDQAVAAPGIDQATQMWHQADEQVMRDAPFDPLTNPKTANYVSKRVHNFIYYDALQNGAITSVWLGRRLGDAP